MCNFKSILPKEISIVFHNWSNCDYHFDIKELVDKLEKKNYLFRKKYWKIHNLFCPNTKLNKLIKIRKKLRKYREKIPHPTDYKLLIVQGLWLAHYQILLILFLNEFIKLNANTKKMIKNVKLAELSTKIATAFVNSQTLKMI